MAATNAIPWRDLGTEEEAQAAITAVLGSNFSRADWRAFVETNALECFKENDSKILCVHPARVSFRHWLVGVKARWVMDFTFDKGAGSSVTVSREYTGL